MPISAHFFQNRHDSYDSETHSDFRRFAMLCSWSVFPQCPREMLFALSPKRLLQSCLVDDIWLQITWKRQATTCAPVPSDLFWLWCLHLFTMFLDTSSMFVILIPRYSRRLLLHSTVWFERFWWHYVKSSSLHFRVHSKRKVWGWLWSYGHG